MKNLLSKIGEKIILPLAFIAAISFNSYGQYSKPNDGQFLNENLKTKGKEIYRDTMQGNHILYKEDVPFIDENNNKGLCNILYDSSSQEEIIFVDNKNKTNLSDNPNSSDNLELIIIKVKDNENIQRGSSIYKRESADLAEIFSKGDKNYNIIKGNIFQILKDNYYKSINKNLEQFGEKSLKLKGKEIFNGELQGGKVMYREDVPYMDFNNEKSLCNIMYLSDGRDEKILIDTKDKTNLIDKDSTSNPTLIEVMIQKDLKTNENFSILSSRLNYSKEDKAKVIRGLAHFSTTYEINMMKIELSKKMEEIEKEFPEIEINIR